MTNKERYIEWAAKQEYVPVFMMPWWMDAVCAGKEWDVLLAENEQGDIIGAMPYLMRKRAWLRYIIMPQQTQIGGIWVTPEVTADRWKTAEVCRIIKEQIDALGIAYCHYLQLGMPVSEGGAKDWTTYAKRKGLTDKGLTGPNDQLMAALASAKKKK